MKHTFDDKKIKNEYDVFCFFFLLFFSYVTRSDRRQMSPLIRENGIFILVKIRSVLAMDDCFLKMDNG